MRIKDAVVFALSIGSLGLAWSCSGGGSSGGGSTSAAITTPSSQTPTVPTSQNPVVSGNVSIPYTLVDPNSAPLSVSVAYSTDQGVTWKPCTQGVGGDPTTGLSSSPTGVAHTFAWNTVTDLGATLTPNVVARVTPTGQSAGASPPFDVDNRVLVPATSAVQLTRGPYLQSTSRTGTIIVWRTATPTDTVVEYGAGTAYGTKTGNPTASETTHAVTITGLTPATSYSYRILAAGAVAGYPSTFATAADTNAQAFTALVFGDSGSGTQDQYNLAMKMAQEKFDLVLHTGDVIYPDGAEKDYAANYFVPYGPFISSHPVFPAMGNHDQMTANGQAYYDAFYVPANNPAGNKSYYSFEWGDAKFVSIETSVLFAGPGPHITWLQNELASNTRRWLVVYMHVPLYSVGLHGDNTTLQNLLEPIFEQYKVDLVLQGHDHNYERTGPIKKFSTDPNYQGVPFIVTGGGGAQTYPIITSHPQTQFSEATYHYTLLTFTHDAIRGRVVREDGSQAEAFTLNHQ